MIANLDHCFSNIGFKPLEWQARAALSDAPRRIVSGCRRSGKTRAGDCEHVQFLAVFAGGGVG